MYFLNYCKTKSNPKQEDYKYSKVKELSHMDLELQLKISIRNTLHK